MSLGEWDGLHMLQEERVRGRISCTNPWRLELGLSCRGNCSHGVGVGGALQCRDGTPDCDWDAKKFTSVGMEIIKTRARRLGWERLVHSF